MNDAELHTLPLQYPYVLLPGSILSLSPSPEVAQPIVDLLQEARHTPPLVFGTAPALPADENAAERLHSYGCRARVLRITRERPPAGSTQPEYELIIEGYERVQLDVSQIFVPSPFLHSVPVVSSSLDTTLSPETCTTFRSCALGLLGEIKGATKTWNLRLEMINIDDPTLFATLCTRLAAKISEAKDHNLPALADSLVALIESNYEHKVEMLSKFNGEARLKAANAIIAQRHTLAVLGPQTNVNPLFPAFGLPGLDF